LQRPRSTTSSRIFYVFATDSFSDVIYEFGGTEVDST